MESIRLIHILLVIKNFSHCIYLFEETRKIIITYTGFWLEHSGETIATLTLYRMQFATVLHAFAETFNSIWFATVWNYFS